MKANILIAVTVGITLWAFNAQAQTIAGAGTPAYNAIPNNEGTAVVFPLLTTNRIPASTTSNIVTRAFEIPQGRNAGLLVNGFIVTNNAQFTVNYQLSPNGTHWSWPPGGLSSGVVASNATPAFSVFLIISNDVVYPARFFRISSITAGTNSLFVSNAVYFYKNTR